MTKDRQPAPPPETFMPRRGAAIVEMLWDYLKRDPEHEDRRQTGVGTKTKLELMQSIEDIRPAKTLYLGICEPSVPTSGVLVVICDDQQLAETALLSKYKEVMRNHAGPFIQTFAELHEWNGATVLSIEQNRAFVWERLDPAVRKAVRGRRRGAIVPMLTL